MRILLLSTLKRRIGPDIFASRSRIIYQLAVGLSKRGHSVSILGTGDSEVPGVEIIPVIEKGWVDLPSSENEFIRDVVYLQKMGQMLLELQDRFDLVHNHSYPDSFASVFEDRLKIPLVTTLHAVADEYLDQIFEKYSKTKLVALSHAYRGSYKKTNIPYVIYNGVDAQLYSFSKEKEDYLFWLGRLPKGKNDQGEFIDPKGVKWAIELSESTQAPLYLAGPCEDMEFFEKHVKPHLSDTIKWVGEVSSEQALPVEKIVSLMQRARAFLMTVNQDEPFGLVMAEAMSCGTPVIGFRRGSVPEVVVDGKTGFVVDPNLGIDALKVALSKIDSINPEDCRRHVEENFTIEKMVDNYEKLYSELLSNGGI